MKISLLFLISIFVFSHSAHAFELGGTTRLSLMEARFIEAPPAPVQQDEIQFTLDHERRIALHDGETSRLGFEFHPFLYGTTVEGNRERQVVLDPRAGYFEWAGETIWVRAGTMTLKWEGTDGLNPMEIATQKDWSDPLNSQTRASAGFAIGRSGENVDIEAAFIPWQTRSLLPGERSAWLPRRATFPLRTDEFELRVPNEVAYRYGERESFHEPRKRNAAARVQVRTSYGDVAVGYYDGLADTPAIVPTLDVVPIQVNPKQIFELLNPVELVPVDYRVRTVAGFYSKALGPWILRLASRYDSPYRTDKEGRFNPDVPTWSQNTVLGVERTFEFSKVMLTGVLQYADVRVPESNSLLSVRDLFDQALLGGLRATFGDDWTLFVSGFYSSKTKSAFEKVDLSYRLSEHWKLSGAVELLDGPEDSLLGVYGRNDRAYVGVSAVY